MANGNIEIYTVPLKEVPYVDHPDLKINDHESTQMPFRYVKGEDGQPIMPKVGMRFSSGGQGLSYADIYVGYAGTDREGCRQGHR